MSESLDEVGSAEWDSVGGSDRADGVPVGEEIERRGESGVVLVGGGDMEETTYHTPMNSILTSIQKAFLNVVLCFHPSLSLRLNILYAKGTCW